MNTMISILAIDVVAIHIIEMFSDIVCTVCMALLVTFNWIKI